MKRFYISIIAVIITAYIFGQAPASFKYQPILRDASGNVRANTTVSIDIVILQGSATGSQVFIETHSVTTNEFGLVNLEIGSKNTSGFASINWANGPYFIKVIVDGTEMGTSQLLSVPYALYSKTAENGFSGDYNDLTNKPTAISNFTMNANAQNITNLANLVNAQDATTKAYVDVLLERIEVLELVNEGFIDSRDGNHYSVVKIGNQIWMAKNLRYLPSVLGSVTGSQTTPYYYVYGYNGTSINDAKATTNYTTYGVLYNWPAAMAGATSSTTNPSGVQGICPTGWHLLSDAEWKELIDYLGGESVTGGKLKEIGTTHWTSPNTGATNEKGFTALPGGYRYDYGTFSGIGNYGLWWSATESSTSSAWRQNMYYNGSSVFRYYDTKEFGFSVRCIKD